MFFLSFFDLAQGQEAIGPIKEMFVVKKVSVEGTRKVEAEAVLEKISTKPDMMLDNYLLRGDIQHIYDMKYFEEVSAWKRGESTLVFKVKEKPIIAKIEFEGNDELSEEDLREQLKSREYNILDIATLNQDINLLEEFYEGKGYYVAKVNYEVRDNNNGSVNVVFQIKEFDQVLVKKITFLGNEAVPDEELKKFMQTREESYFSAMSGSGNFKETDFQIDIERLKHLYKTKGYLQVNISNPIVTVSDDKKWIFVTIQITEGPQFSVNNIFFNGELLFTEKEMNEKIKLKSEDIYNEENLRLDIQTLTEMYQDKGYAFANVLRTLEIVPGENKVDIYFSFEKGEICYFGKIIVKGNSKTRDKVIRRELKIHEGMMYSGSKLRISKENVNRLGFFEQGSVIFNTVSPKGRSNVLDVEISIKERSTGQISVGAGYSTATQGFIQASISQSNFRGLGQNLNFNLSLANNQQIYNLGFTEPYFLDTKWTAGADYFKTFSGFIRSFTYEKHGFDVRVGYPIFDYTRLFITYRYEDNEIGDVINPTIDPTIENGSASSVQTSLILDKRNNIFEPTDGHYAKGSVEYTGLGGTQRWLRTEIEGRYYEPIWEDLVFRTRTSVSQLYKTTGRDIPRIEKFALGGARNMRGYNLNDIGPLVRARNLRTNGLETFNQGGLFQVLSTIELEHPLIKEAGLKWVLFSDFGNVYPRYIGEDGDYSLRANYGFGFRWFSPIGVLRFEFGFPINKREREAPNQFNFDIGQLF